MSETDPRKALASIVNGLQNNFKRFSRTARCKAWKSLQTSQGKKEIEKLLNYPNYKMNDLPKILSFKEWLLKN